MKASPCFSQYSSNVLLLSVAYIVQVLHTDDVDHLASPVNLGGLHLTETNMPDLAIPLQFCNYPQRLFYGHLGIDAVQLPEVDDFRLQITQTHLDLLRQILRSANG